MSCRVVSFVSCHVMSCHVSSCVCVSLSLLSLSFLCFVFYLACLITYVQYSYSARYSTLLSTSLAHQSRKTRAKLGTNAFFSFFFGLGWVGGSVGRRVGSEGRGGRGGEGKRAE